MLLLIDVLITLVILGVCLGLLLWLIDSAPLPEPFSKIKPLLHWLVLAIAVIWLISVILGLSGMSASPPLIFHWNGVR